MADELVALAPGTRVSGRWTILKKLGAGAFGAVYLCKDGKGTVAALKTEPIDTRQPLLVMEATVLNALGKKLQNADGQHFCRLLDLGRSEQRNATPGGDTVFNYVVMTVVGTPLDKLVRDAGDRFSPGTAIGVSIQLLSAIKALHNVGFLHRDIKPANTAIGRAETNEHRLLYLIDFGMARQFLRPDGTQRRPRASANFRGTPIYAPISAHIKRDYSRKDDVESWFYVMVKFYKGAVPWKFANDVKEIGRMKCRRMEGQPDEIRQQAITELIGGCPPEFTQILAHIDGLQLEDRPNYEMIETMLREHLTRSRVPEHPYDWEVGRRNAMAQAQSEAARRKKDNTKEGGGGKNNTQG
ncbi:hypothetical protein niasHT_007506 [Heterodera trifolii]|uniref:Protein kinase domain-containing protein n=1 Tax=Heterodera trifolii TaxID=157864 RepID=A0ABD2LPS0_9BILA